jgi:hypothetical protein
MQKKKDPVVCKLEKGVILVNVASKQTMHSSPLPYGDFLKQ